MTKVYHVPAWVLALMIFVVAGSATTAGIGTYLIATDAAHTKHILNRDFCDTLHILIQPGPPATTDRSRAVASAMRNLSERLGCAL